MRMRITWPGLLLTLVVFLGWPALASPADQPSRAGLGGKIANFLVHGASGKALRLNSLTGSKAVVLVFLSFECPASTGYAPVLADLVKTYRARGVAFIGIASGADAEAAALSGHAAAFQPLTVTGDRHGAAADALAAEVTPEAFVLDADFVLRYRGRIDDRYAARLKARTRVGRQDLRQALDEVLAGKPVSEPATRAIGCPLERTGPKASAGKVTYYRDVLPILQEHCQACHRSGEIAPFALTTYRQAVRWATDIKEYTQARKMPPWKPVAGPAFHDERKLTAAEMATLAAWVDGGTPAGDPRAAPPPRSFKDDWYLGKPDLILKVDDDFQLAANGPDLYRFFALPTNLAEDKYVTAVQVRPGNRRVTHHAVLFVDRAGRARRFEKQSRADTGTTGDRGPGYSLPMAVSFLPGFLPEGGLGGWAPGLIPRHLPDDTAFYLPKGADVVMQLHYHRTGRIEKDRTMVGLYFAKKPARRRMQGVTVPGHFLFIPTGRQRYRVHGSAWLSQDCALHALMPHMHLLGREIKLTMVPPSGPARTLIAIKDWDFNWQENYVFKQPIAAPAGTRIDIEGTYDNSEHNPFNPFQPPRPVFVGLETTNEMCVGFLGVTADRPGPIRYSIQPRIQGLDWAPSWGIPMLGL